MFLTLSGERNARLCTVRLLDNTVRQKFAGKCSDEKTTESEDKNVTGACLLYEFYVSWTGQQSNGK